MTIWYDNDSRVLNVVRLTASTSLLEPTAGAVPGKDIGARIDFPPGQTRAEVFAELAAGATDSYLVRGQQGQTMSVEITSPNSNVLLKVGAPVYGRVTYQMMESYWPTVLTDPSSHEKDRAHAQWLEGVTKIVFSTTLNNVSWKNSILIRDNIAGEIAKLKKQPGKDLVIYGSPGFAQSLMQLDLIDEYRLTVNPVILGKGKPLFTSTPDMTRLKLLQSRTFDSGVVSLFYQAQRT